VQSNDVQARGRYDPGFFPPLFAVEDRHFWFRARCRVVATLAAQVVAGLAPGYRVLEVGCGTGNVLRALVEACGSGRVVGIDLFHEGLRYARGRSTAALVQGDLHRPPFAAPFDLVGMFDVLEHLPDDERVLHQLAELVKPDGALLLTVPAHPSLWSYFDVASRHLRRYTTRGLTATLGAAGYRVEYLTEYMSLLFPAAWLGRRLVGWRHGRPAASAEQSRELAHGELRVIPVVNGLLGSLLAPEAPLIARRWRLPLGTSLLALARRR
jgi:SAM-dependent methyltransferase